MQRPATHLSADCQRHLEHLEVPAMTPNLRTALDCAVAACHGCVVCGELIKPFPAGSHCVRVYAGEEQFAYQVVGAINRKTIAVIFSDGGCDWYHTTMRRTWTKGATRELADALCQEMAS
jgi:hypothetical protein